MRRGERGGDEKRGHDEKPDIRIDSVGRQPCRTLDSLPRGYRISRRTSAPAAPSPDCIDRPCCNKRLERVGCPYEFPRRSLDGFPSWQSAISAIFSGTTDICVRMRRSLKIPRFSPLASGRECSTSDTCFSRISEKRGCWVARGWFFYKPDIDFLVKPSVRDRVPSL